MDDIDEKPAKRARKAGAETPLRQFMVSEAGPPDKVRKVAFILQTCALTARREFEERTGAKAGQCMQAAESALTRADLSRDLWKEGQNWLDESAPPALTESGRRYFRLKEEAEDVQAAKKDAGIRDWADASDEAMSAFRNSYEARRAKRKAARGTIGA